MKKIAVYKFIVAIIGAGAVIFTSSGMPLHAVTSKWCAIVVPLSGKDSVIVPKETKIINHNLKKAALKVEALRKQAEIAPGHVAWKIPNAMLRSCNIALPTYVNAAGIEVAQTTDRTANILLDNIGIISEMSAEEMVKYFKKINKKKLFFDPNSISITCWINGLVLIHEKGNVRSSSDRIILALKVSSQDDKLTKITTLLDDEIGKKLGISSKRGVPCVPLAVYNKLERSQALELIDKLTALKSSLAFDRKPFRLRQFYVKQLCLKNGSTLEGPWDIQNFTYVSQTQII